MLQRLVESGKQGKFGVASYQRESEANFVARLLSRRFPTAKVVVTYHYCVVINPQFYYAGSVGFSNGIIVKL